MKIPSLHDWRDSSDRSAPLQMAVDEALFVESGESDTGAARFYRWAAPAITIGYFDDHPGITDPATSPVRRLTGGGRVEHGEDLTFVLVFPRSLPICEWTTEERYRWIHSALADALGEAGFPVRLEDTASASPRGPCFENPVTWDLLCPKSGTKFGGGAQRRTRLGVIHQGSIRLPESLRQPEGEWIAGFLSRLADSVSPLSGEAISRIEKKATTLAEERYLTRSWNEGKGMIRT